MPFSCNGKSYNLTIMNVNIHILECAKAVSTTTAMQQRLQVSKNKTQETESTLVCPNTAWSSLKQSSVGREVLCSLVYGGQWLFFNALSAGTKGLNPGVLKKKLQQWLTERPVYSVVEFLNWGDSDYSNLWIF